MHVLCLAVDPLLSDPFFEKDHCMSPAIIGLSLILIGTRGNSKAYLVVFKVYRFTEPSSEDFRVLVALQHSYTFRIDLNHLFKQANNKVGFRLECFWTGVDWVKANIPPESSLRFSHSL